jgi:hypothetical protein
MTRADIVNVVARPRSLFTFAFDCFDTEERIIASFQHRAFRSSGTIVVDGVEYIITRAGTGLVVRVPESEKAAVTIVYEGRGQMSVRFGGRSLTIARAGIGFRMVLVSKNGPIGKLGLRDLFGRTMILDSEEELPPLVVGALFWLAVARRRQLLTVGRR